MKFLILLITIIKLTTTQVVPSCNTNNDCNNLYTFKSQRCSTTCVSYGEQAYKGVPSSTQTCKDSFNFVTRCGSLAAVGCTITDPTTQRCVTNNVVNNKCTAPTVTPTKYSSLNARCDLTTNPPEICPANQNCVAKVCRLRLSAGKFCQSTETGCMAGTSCDNGECVFNFSKRDGESCASSVVCKSQVCQNGRCQTSDKAPCFSDSDCGSGVCRKSSPQSTTDERGTCFFPLLETNSAYSQCLYHKCFSQPLTTTCQECQTELVKYLCSLNCLKKVDERYQSSNAFVYDCAALTATPFVEGTDCEVVQQFKNCDAVVKY